MPSRRHVLGGLAGIGGVGLGYTLTTDSIEANPGTDSDANWPMPRYNTRNTAYSPDAKAPRDEAQVRWKADIGWLASEVPIIVEGTVFFPTREGLYALNSTTGEERWRFEPGDHADITESFFHDGVVFTVAKSEDRLYALDAESGDVVWVRENLDDYVTAFHLVADEHVRNPKLYIGMRNGKVLQIDPDTGETMWQTDLFGAITAFSHFLYLYVGTASGEVYTYLDDHDVPREGARQLAGTQVESITPSSNGVLVTMFGGPSKLFHRDDMRSQSHWVVDTEWANAPPARMGTRFYTGGYEGLFSWRNYDHKQFWKIKTRFDRAGLVAAGDTVYAASSEGIHAFDCNGGIGVGSVRVNAERWKFPVKDGSVSSLAVADSALFAGRIGTQENETTLYCLEEA